MDTDEFPLHWKGDRVADLVHKKKSALRSGRSADGLLGQQRGRKRKGTGERRKKPKVLDSVPLSQWIWEKCVFFHRKRKIYPWGFVDPGKETRFQEHFALTFPNNRRDVLAFVSFCILLKNFSGMYQFLSSPGDVPWTSFDFSTLVYRFLLSAYLTYGFSRTRVSWFAKFFYRRIILSSLWWLLPPMILSEVCACSQNSKALHVKMVVTLFAFVNCIRSGSWIQAAIASAVLCFVPLGYYYQALERQKHPWKTELCFDMLLTNLAGSAAGIACNAWLQVGRRLEWHRSNKHSHPADHSCDARPQARSCSSLSSLSGVSESEREDWSRSGSASASKFEAGPEAAHSPLRNSVGSLSIGGPEMPMPVDSLSRSARGSNLNSRSQSAGDDSFSVHTRVQQWLDEQAAAAPDGRQKLD